MKIIIDNKTYEYSHSAILNLLREPEFVKGVLDGSIVLPSELSYLQSETLFETEKDIEHNAALA